MTTLEDEQEELGELLLRQERLNEPWLKEEPDGQVQDDMVPFFCSTIDTRESGKETPAKPTTLGDWGNPSNPIDAENPPYYYGMGTSESPIYFTSMEPN